MKNELLSLRNVGKAFLKDLEILGIKTIDQLATQDADYLYSELQRITKTKQDPCVWDTFAAIIHESKTGEKLPWWYWTPIRKAKTNALSQ
jgi:nucleotidyltransferase/DNA polymerase involved in DNA repair